jgi:hypothetical protein
MSMNTVQFDPKIATDLQIDWRRHASAHNSDPFADLLSDRLKRHVDADRRDPDAKRSHAASDPISGRPPRLVVAHARTIRGEAKEVDHPADRRLADHTDCATDEGCATPADQTAEAEDGAAENAPAPETEAATDAAPAADQPIEVTDGQTDPAAPVPMAVVAVQSGNAEAAVSVQEAAAILPAPTPAEGQGVVPEQAENATPDGSQADADDVADQQAVAAMAEAGLSELAATLIDGNAAPAGGTEPIPAATPTAAVPAAPATAEQPLLQVLEAAAPLAEVAPAPAQAEPHRPAMDIKLRPGTTPRAHAAAADPAPSSTAASQSVLPQQAALPQPGAAGEFGAWGETLDQSLSADGSGPGWAFHLAQGAAGKRADFVAQLRQHLQNLPAHEQVAVHIQRAVRERTGRFSIQLSPSELGRIEVKLEIDEEKRVTASVTVERPSTLELLQRDTKGLERALHNAGLNMEGGDLSFSLGRGSDQEFAQDLNRSAATAAGGTGLDAASDGDQPVGPAAQVLDTAAGIENLQV